MNETVKTTENNIIQTVFFLRWISQLRRTRPEMINRIENAIIQAARNAGGEVSRSRQCITAVYNENNVGLWLDILMLTETIFDVLENEKSELFGYAFLIGKDFEDKPETLCRSLAIGPQDGGIFLDPAARDSLKTFVVYEQIQKWPSNQDAAHQETHNRKNLVRIKEFKNLISGSQRNSQLTKTIQTALRQGGKQSILIIGPAYSGKRDGVNRFCLEKQADFPPLSIRFGTGGLNALGDAYSDQIRKLTEKSKKETQDAAAEITCLWQFLFQQRLRDEISPDMFRSGRRFFSLLLETYTGIAKQRNRIPILILENVHLAEKSAAQIFIDAMRAVPNKQAIIILGTCGKEMADAKLKNWEEIFSRVIKLTGENSVRPSIQIPLELWEFAYLLYLFNQCFPAYMFVRLLTEEGKNPATIIRALNILHAQGIIDSIEDPCLRIGSFSPKAGTVPKEKKELIKAMVSRRLLFYVKQGNISPCLNLLSFLTELHAGENIEDELILKSLTADIVNGTVRDIENAINSGMLKTIAGAERTEAIIYIYKTMKTLLTGTENEIKSAFTNAAPDCSAFPVLKTQSLANISAYQLGERNVKPALEAIKETILLSQKKNNYCLAQSYRLFSLANLSRQQAGETNEYMNFAMEHAEKSGNNHELGISAYYAAASQFLFGNISKAIRLASKARERALAAGLPDWADRARFLEGRLIFEIGSYNNALDIFETLWKKPSGSCSPEKDRMLAAWVYRAKVFLRDSSIKKPENSGCDTDLFETEAAYLAGNFKKTIELANALSPPVTSDDFLFTEQPDWRSGWTQSESLYFPLDEIWKRMRCAYHSLALCHISAEAGQEALHNIRCVLRDEQLSDMDPWDAFYFYAWYRILEYAGAEQIDKNTAISLAFKRLQRRASRIDDIETRRQFLSQPRWNGELSCAAREHRLI